MYKQKLIDLLKSNEDVKTAMEKLEFGCSIKIIELGSPTLQEYGRDDGQFGEEFYVVGYDNNTIYPNDEIEYDVEQIESYINGKIKLPNEIQSIEIIGLPLQERFIRMYCKNKNKSTNFYNDGFYIEGIGFIKIDNLKDFSEQSEEIYMNIFNALASIK